MKKFYKIVSTQEIANGGYKILLDDKPLKTPQKQDLVLSGPDLAEAVMQEWASAQADFTPDDLPLTQLAMTAQDYVSTARPEIEAKLFDYLEADLICYHSQEEPKRAAHEAEHWTPWVNWFAKELKIKRPIITDLSIHSLSDADKAAFHHYLDGLGLDHFTIFQLLVALSGSVILSAAFLAGKIGAEDIFKLSKLEELFTIEFLDIEKHGPDPAQAKEFARLKQDFEACARYLALL